MPHFSAVRTDRRACLLGMGDRTFVRFLSPPEENECSDRCGTL